MKVKKAIPIEHFQLKVTFSNGETYVWDLRGKLSGSIFAPLEDPMYFNHVAIDEAGGCFWPNKADICPDFLYQVATGKECASPPKESA